MSTPGVGDWLTCRRVADRVARLDPVLRRAVSSRDSAMGEIAAALVSRGGKRLRPALLLLAAEYGPAAGSRVVEARLLRAAAALELIHVASLYHDDVMDRATTRRGSPSANALWGNSTATVGGTFLFARATALLSRLGDEVAKASSDAMVRICTGQLREVENSYNVDLAEQEHLEILELKTATLFELPCQVGARLAEATEYATALVEYARHLGLAFQLTDDALDLAGDIRQLGKAPVNDLREGVYSYPVIRSMGGTGADQGRLRGLLIQRRLSEHDLHEIVGIVQASGAVAEALDRARQSAALAQQCLRGFPQGDATDSLRRLPEFAVSRSH